MKKTERNKEPENHDYNYEQTLFCNDKRLPHFTQKNQGPERKDEVKV